MKKLFTLCLSLFALASMSGQNLLTNPGFETWASGAAAPWDIYPVTSATVVQETSLVKEGSSAIKVSATATSSLSQFVGQTYNVGDTYVLSFDYYVVSGDGTDTRIWSGWKNTSAASGSSGDIDHDYDVLRLGGGSTSQYWPSNTGTWSSQTCETTVPTGALGFDFRVRTYNGAVVVYDNFSFTKKGGSSITADKADALKGVYTAAGYVSVVADASVKVIDVYNAQGKLITKVKATEGLNTIPTEAGQLLIIKAGNKVSKVITK
ncbi:MAG: hypothetical protein ACK5MK_03795 [Dysgonomonas sp.]